MVSVGAWTKQIHTLHIDSNLQWQLIATSLPSVNKSQAMKASFTDDSESGRMDEEVDRSEKD